MGPGRICHWALLCIAVLCIQCSSAKNGTASEEPSNNSTSSAGRSGRKFYGNNPDSPYVAIPVGYYAPDGSKQAGDADGDQGQRVSVPTSFEEFRPDGIKPRNSYYPAYYASKGAAAPQQWKGDSGSDDSAPAWTPSPADMMMAMNMMNGNDQPDDQPTGLLQKLTSDPTTAFLAIVLPFSILLAAVLPTLATVIFNNADGGMSIPTITTVATGNAGRGLHQSSLVKPILEAIGSFSARSSSGNHHHPCLQKAFCEATSGSANGTDFRSVQRSIYKAFSLVDDFWLDTLGVKQLKEAMGTGDCGKIKCSVSAPKEHKLKKT